ncbi:MAG: 2-dehydropantoate 2-reductase N-terminal domain-containing protein [Vicinamibacterales bacterium]
MSFVAADLWLVVASVLTGVFILRNDARALLFGVSLGSSMVFFGLYAFTYDLRTGLLFDFSAGEVFGKAVTLYNLLAGLLIMALSWRDRGHRVSRPRILVYGVGAIGGLFAGKLARAGFDVTALARGAWATRLREKGLVLRDALRGTSETFRLPIIEELPPEDTYDYVLVVMQKHQVGAVLPSLALNASPNIVFVVNTPSGYAGWIAAVGQDRLMIGFPSAGGERLDGVVEYFVGRGLARIFQSTTFGEVDGSNTDRLRRLVAIFREAGFSPTSSRNIGDWQRTHVAVVLAIAWALYRHGCDATALAHSPRDLRDMVLAIRKGFRCLRALGHRVTPARLNYFFLPVWLLVGIFRIAMRTRLVDVAMARHAKNGRGEMERLRDEFLALAATSNVDMPVANALYGPTPPTALGG